MIEERDDTFLARWLNNELTEEELKEFQSSPEYVHYQKIRLGSEAIRSDSFDMEGMLTRIKELKEKNGKKETKILALWVYGIAASAVLLIGFFFFFNRDTTFSTGYGEQLSFYLPDSSEVMLNANSKVAFNKSGWGESRELSLSGEGYFKVKKGSKFKITTEVGLVEVLGTQFNVRVSEDLFDVICYEGKVRVSEKAHEVILQPGDSYRSIGGVVSEMTTNEQTPAWLSGESTFKSMPLRFVLEALENQYNITFEGELDQDTTIYTGGFPHDDLRLALKLVLGSLQIDYTIKDDRVILEK